MKDKTLKDDTNNFNSRPILSLSLLGPNRSSHSGLIKNSSSRNWPGK